MSKYKPIIPYSDEDLINRFTKSIDNIDNIDNTEICIICTINKIEYQLKNCGHYYCEKCILEVIRKYNKCAFCRDKINRF